MDRLFRIESFDMKGLIIKNQNGYFTIAGAEGATALARSRGRTKRKGSILVGDWVEYEQTKDSAPPSAYCQYQSAGAYGGR